MVSEGGQKVAKSGHGQKPQANPHGGRKNRSEKKPKKTTFLTTFSGFHKNREKHHFFDFSQPAAKPSKLTVKEAGFPLNWPFWPE